MPPKTPQSPKPSRELDNEPKTRCLQHPSVRTEQHDTARTTLGAAQAVVRQLLADPDFSQENLRKWCQPIVLFSFLLLLTARIRSYPTIANYIASIVQNPLLHKLECVASVVAVSLGCILVSCAARLVLWMVDTLARGFAGMDLNRPVPKVPGGRGDLELTQANLIVGGLFT